MAGSLECGGAFWGLVLEEEDDDDDDDDDDGSDSEEEEDAFVAEREVDRVLGEPGSEKGLVQIFLST